MMQYAYTMPANSLGVTMRQFYYHPNQASWAVAGTPPSSGPPAGFTVYTPAKDAPDGSCFSLTCGPPWVAIQAAALVGVGYLVGRHFGHPVLGAIAPPVLYFGAFAMFGFRQS